MQHAETVQTREAEFWDRVAQESCKDDTALTVAKSDLFDTTMPWLGFMDMQGLTQTVFDHIEIKPGLRVLDLGCGQGFLSVALAHRGAEVVGIDISAGSISRCQRRADLSGMAEHTRFEVMDCESLDFPDSSFDAVVGCFVLHHLDLAKAAHEIHRVLKPGGRAAFVETMGLNPVLMAARAMLPGRMGIEKASSEDEYPLTGQRIDTLRRGFAGRFGTEFPHLIFFRMGGYLPFMNNAFGRAILSLADHSLGLLKPMRAWSYYGIVTMDRDKETAG